MKVFLYTPFYPPNSQAAAIRTFWFAETLKHQGSEVKIVTSENMTFSPADNKKSFSKRFVFEILAGIELFVRILFSNHHLYILSSPPFITVSLGHLACRLRKHKYIIDVRDIYPDVYFAQGLMSRSSKLGKLVLKFTQKMYTNAHGVLTVTPGLVEKIKTLAPESQVELLINGFDKELFKHSIEKFKKFTVMFHGNMGKIQNLEVILEVARKLETIDSEIEFVFIGEGPQAKLFNSPQPQNVKYLGPKKYLEIPDLIAKAHVGFSARRDDEIGADAFPVKVFEYLGVGIPAIMTPKSGVMTKMVESGIYEFGNDEVEKIAEKILDLKKTGVRVSLKEEISRQEVSKKILKFLPP